ncbi:MAG: M28 family peptidase [Planctomycetota bacterium]
MRPWFCRFSHATLAVQRGLRVTIAPWVGGAPQRSAAARASTPPTMTTAFLSRCSAGALAVAFAAVLWSTARAPAQSRAQSRLLANDRAAGAAAVLPEHCRAWLGQLASPEFEGRGTGQDGFRKAAEFVSAHFEELGLKPAGDDGTFLQAVPWLRSRIDPTETFVEFRSTAGEVHRVPAERLAGQASQSTRASGNVVLVVLPAAAASDRQATAAVAAKLDLAGKVVLLHIQSGVPGANPALSSFRAVAELRDKDPAAILVLESAAVGGGLVTRTGPGRGAANRAVRGARLSLASLRIGGDDANAILTAGQAEGALANVGVTELNLEATVRVEVAEEQAPAWNVVGVLPGRDETLREEYVVIGSHLDHLGRRGATIYPGADDDGSGTTGVLAVATMFAKNSVRPPRSVLFVCFCGEEAGLVGSSFFADHCPVPLASIVGELQMDMIGRNEESAHESAQDNLNTLHLVGTEKLSRDMHELCLAKNETAGFELEWDEEDVFFRSDHANFAKKGIPIAFFFTGFHNDYHRPTDTPDKIDYDKLLRVATYVYDIGFELGTMTGRPLVDEDLWQQNRKRLRGVETPAAPMRGQK